MDKEVIQKATGLMNKAIDNLKRGLSTIHTGRASASLLNGVFVEYYGTSVAINKVANVIVREARLIEIRPFDNNSLPSIEKAILKSNLGMTPVNNGKIIRLEIPALTEERRTEFTKIAKKIGEEHRVEIRNARRQANDELKDLYKDKKISEDLMHTCEEKIQKITNDYITKVDEIMRTKNNEIMEI